MVTLVGTRICRYFQSNFNGGSITANLGVQSEAKIWKFYFLNNADLEQREWYENINHCKAFGLLVQ